MVGCSGSGRDVDGERWWLCCTAASDVMRLMMISKMIVILIARVLAVVMTIATALFRSWTRMPWSCAKLRAR